LGGKGMGLLTSPSPKGMDFFFLVFFSLFFSFFIGVFFIFFQMSEKKGKVKTKIEKRQVKMNKES